MPFKSDSQRRYFNWAAKNGKIKQSTVDEFNKASKNMDLPEKLNDKRYKFNKLQKLIK